MHTVTTEQQLVEVVRSGSRVRVRGAGTKSAPEPDGGVGVCMGGMTGVLQYDPGEFTFTALAGTRLSEVEGLLAEKNQYLPFDPPLVEAGATLGGTVATGVSGSGRLRYGGVRDFLLGARIVTGEGQAVMAGSKVVKNAAGFDLPKLMVGSLGRYGLLTELTFKVFPRPECSATLVFEAGAVAEGVTLMNRLAGSQYDLACLDMDDAHRVWARLAGFRQAVAARAERVLREVAAPGRVTTEDEDHRFWRDAREFAWIPPGHDLIKIALTPDKIEPLSAAFATLPKRFCVGGHLAWIGWPEGKTLEPLETTLQQLGCAGAAITGASPRRTLGRPQGGAFAARLQTALDPHHKFSSD
ncbi:putative FAD-linked oxidoreductase [Pirellulimonas nuda]|uniref:Putative FAD-linked oxidoreductase n=1 Tax=Pirellulimonas nuda TaxID=2528009 RepID=A0A518DAM3_9BACT|nr:FAD-binding protein [Pirellulimonas nuda]QDU88529.1 putative FAD-linked oxidoreductase [Pirellulimonas nuda]